MKSSRRHLHTLSLTAFCNFGMYSEFDTIQISYSGVSISTSAEMNDIQTNGSQIS